MSTWLLVLQYTVISVFSFCKCLSHSRVLDKTNTSVIVSLLILPRLFCPSAWRGVDGEGGLGTR